MISVSMEKAGRCSARSRALPPRRSLGQGGGSRRNRKSTAGKSSFLHRLVTQSNYVGYNFLAMLNEDSITELKGSLRGRLIQPADADYDEARKVYNGMIHKKPRLIARCADVADVIRSVNFARDNDLLVSIRGGGHNAGGLGICDDGLVIDLARSNTRESILRLARSQPAADASGATLIMLRMRSDSRRRAESFPQLASAD